MDAISQTAMERVRKARAELIMSHRFYGVLVSNVEVVITRTVETAATDGHKHYWNPDFVATLTQDQLLFVQAHESEHDARHHSTRRFSREPVEWNVAGDYAINIDLVDERIGQAPPWVLIDTKYRGMSAEDIYRARELDEQQQPQPQPQDGEGDEGDNAQGDQEGDQGGDQGEGNDDQGDDQGEGEGEGTADGANDDGEGEGGEGEQAGNGRSRDPGRCGEVLDAPGEAADQADTDQRWERITRQAAALAKSVGQLPGHITREIERANNPTQDWREVLRAWFDQGALRTETWNRPNRRFIGQGLILPGSQRDGVNKAVFVIDTSGSMDTIALACIQNEAQAVIDDGVVDEVVVVYGDTRVTRVDTFRAGDEIEFDPRGGGGTDMKPLFAHVAQEHDDASLIVCFTDLEIGEPGPEPHCPVLFAVTGYPDRVRELIEHAPWGSVGIDVGAH